MIKEKVKAFDTFVRTLKTESLWGDIGAACIMAGWTNLAGALTPLKGAAPTNAGGLFQDADLDSGIGLKGDGSTKYLNSNRAGNEDVEDDAHLSVFITQSKTAASVRYAGWLDVSPTRYTQLFSDSSNTAGFVNSATPTYAPSTTGINFFGISRSDSTTQDLRLNGASQSNASSLVASSSLNPFVFARSYGGSPDSFFDGRLAFYSIGSAIPNLAALDSAVSTLMSSLRGIAEKNYDADALDYIRRVEEADGSYLETPVKDAINTFVVGCKKDGIWDAIKASCILCGARTISGALVPLVGAAPAPYNFASGDYDRSSGLKGDGGTKYLDTNRADNADPAGDKHYAVYATTAPNNITIGLNAAGVPSQMYYSAGNFLPYLRFGTTSGISGGAVAGFHAMKRVDSANVNAVCPAGSTTFGSAEALSGINAYVFARNNGGVADVKSSSRLAFYSIGSSLDLAALDARVTTLVTKIAAAI